MNQPNVVMKYYLKQLGMSIKSNSALHEYRVNFVGGREATAYYTSDLSDAMDTAIAMANERRSTQ